MYIDPCNLILDPNLAKMYFYLIKEVQKFKNIKKLTSSNRFFTTFDKFYWFDRFFTVSH